jgi:hypothetical protein
MAIFVRKGSLRSGYARIAPEPRVISNGKKTKRGMR